MEDLKPDRPYVMVLSDPPTLNRALQGYLARVGMVKVVRLAAAARAMLEEPVECLGYIGDADHDPRGAFELCRVMRQRWQDAPRAILTREQTRERTVLASRHGAFLVPKPVDLVSFYQFVEASSQHRGSGTYAKTDRAEALISRARLTPREVEVLRAFLRGRSADEVAESLGMARKTLNNHVVAILRKTGHDTMQKLVVSLLVDRAETA